MKYKGPNLEYDGQLHPDGEFDLGNSGAGTVTIDFNKGNRQKITMTGNCTFAAPSNLKAGTTYVLRLIGDGAALRTPIWNAVFKWAGPTPTLSGASSQDIFAFYCDGTNLHGSSVTMNGLLIGRTILTNTAGGQTFTTSNRTKKILVQLIAGGGGGGGSDGSANNAAAGGGGGSGSFAEKLFDTLPTTAYSYTVGVGGTAGAVGATGGTGGNSSFTVDLVTVTGNGGLGGVGMAAGTTALMALGGNGGAVSTNGDVNTAGQAGFYGIRVSGTVAVGGVGASGYFGGGGNGRNTQGAGNAAGNYGAGGGGAVSIGNNDNVGGVGSQGVIIVWEFS